MEKLTSKKFPAKSSLAARGTAAQNARRGARAVHPSRDVPSSFFTADRITAKLPPVHRVGCARRLRSVRFNLRNSDQFALLNVPEIRYWLIWHRRVLLVSAASRMLDSNFCSLNAAATLLDIPPSSLCVLLQRFRAGGDTALMPKAKTPLTTTGCRLSVYLQV